ncbi:hypothetical protein [Sporosarcina psychrophila]|uniref:Apea-like HEPN domain-containing protein n=1 Tax=Sporosarcina psychrophila TaxID=1476 RepID=A0ABV2KAN5_SPOPS
MSLEEEIKKLIVTHEGIDISIDEKSVTVKWKENVYQEEINDEEELGELKNLLDILCSIIDIEEVAEIEIEDSSNIILQSVLWEGEFSVSLDLFSSEAILTVLEICKYIKAKDKDITIELFNYYFFNLNSNNWSRELNFGFDEEGYENDQLLSIFKTIKNFFEYGYKERSCCYAKDYIEYPITMAHSFDAFFGMYDEVYTAPEKLVDTAINFEISTISEYFWNQCLKNQKSDNEETYSDTNISTLKIYNINTFLNLDIDSLEFVDKSYEVALNILFKLSHEHEIELNISEIPDFDDESYLDVYDEIGNFDEIKEHTIKKIYDNDLINYYYRAINMEESEFKFLAFYQILECIYDEVHLHATVQDVKHIINSDWFSKHSDRDIKEVIQVVETFNKKRTDKEKLTLVLENYFKGSAHDKAFYLANKSIIKTLIDMNLLKKAEELKDIQRFVGIIYDFRCECTHSNRSYPIRSMHESNGNLKGYIYLIKKLAEKIIINYEKSLSI